jgi:hypothetical protein
VHTVYIANMISFVIAYSFEISATAFFLPNPTEGSFWAFPQSNFIIPWALFKKFPFFRDIAHVRSWRDSLAAKCSRIPFKSQQPFGSVSSVGSSRQHL